MWMGGVVERLYRMGRPLSHSSGTTSSWDPTLVCEPVMLRTQQGSSRSRRVSVTVVNGKVSPHR